MTRWATVSLLFVTSCRAESGVVTEEGRAEPSKNPVSVEDYLPSSVIPLGTLDLGEIEGEVTLEESPADYRVIVQFQRIGPDLKRRLMLSVTCRLLTVDGKDVSVGEGVRPLGVESGDRFWIPFSFRRTPDPGRISAVVVSVGDTPTKFPLTR